MNTKRVFVSMTCCLAALALLAGCFGSPSEKARKHRERAAEYFKEGKYKEASVEYQAAVQKWPEDTEALFGLARVFDALGEPREYRDALQKIVTVSPNHTGACVELGGLLWAGGDFAGAMKLAEQALAKAPEAPEALALRARALGGLGKLAEAREGWRAVLAGKGAAEKNYAEAAELEAYAGEANAARRLLEEGVKRFPSSTALLLDLADLLSARGAYSDAESALQRASALNPDDPQAYGARARFYCRKGRPEEARAVLKVGQQKLAGDPAKSAQMAIERSRVLVGLGDFEEATSALEVERKRNPSDEDLSEALADVLIIRGKIDEARALLDETRHPSTLPRLERMLRARLYLREGRSHSALQILENLAAKGDLRVETRLLYAAALAQEGRWGQARRQYELVLRRLPEHVIARLELARVLGAQGEYGGALSLIGLLPQRVQKATRIELLRAELLLRGGDANAARHVASRLLEAAPRSPQIQKLLADTDWALGNLKAADAGYRKARELAPKDIRLLLAWASFLASQAEPLGPIVREIEAFQKSNGEDPRALNWIAAEYLRRKDYPSAARFLDRSLLKEPNYWETKLLKARVLWASGDEAKALVAYEGAIKNNPYQPDAYNDLGQLLTKRGDTARAEETYRKLLEVYPGEPKSSNNLACLYLAQGRFPEALPLALAAYAGEPKNPAVLDTLGWALEKSGRSKEAEGFLRAAEKWLGGSPEFLLHRAVNLRSLGKAAEARPLLNRLMEMAPNSPFATQAREELAKR